MSNKQNLERLSSIMKGLLIYKRKIKLLEHLIQKYPNETREIVFKNNNINFMPIG